MLLQLAGSRLMNLTGRKDTDSLALDELTRMTGRTTGTVAGRLSELTNDQLVERVGKGAYRLTTMGIRVVMRTIFPKVSQLAER
jgi:DNA-binding IclR family transcriptional regulator